MSLTISTTEKSFNLSNVSGLMGIEAMLTHNSTYSSSNTGVYLGVTQIMAMKRDFYGGISDMRWDIHSMTEERRR